jgi:crotonobetainyl-CoA:carnitine CoA-transferase CaiB-like acyl-CoA transferase
MGPDYPFVPGYDPVIQAMCGIMELTGDTAGPPTLAGIPVTDLKAGDEVYAGVLGALVELAETGAGSRIDVSMLQAAASWLITTLPLLNFEHAHDEVTRCGNQHRKFIPTDVFKTSDGYLYMAVGNDLQWRRLVTLKKFAECTSPARFQNAGRHAERNAMFSELRDVFVRYTTAEIVADLKAAQIPYSEVHDIHQVANLEAIRTKMTHTVMPDGTRLNLQPLPVDRGDAPLELSFAPRYGEHSRTILREIGMTDARIGQLVASGLIVADA